MEEIDVGIITVVAEELVAVTDYFKNNNSYYEIKEESKARRHFFGKIEKTPDECLRAVAIQTIEQGNRSVVSAYNLLAEKYNPKVIILMGIAGSINKKVKLCDVVIANSVFYYDKRSIEDSGTKRRLDPFKMSAWTKELLNYYHLKKRNEEPELNSSVGSYSEKFKSYSGPVGCGEAVIKYKDAPERKWLLEVSNETLALETEASGFTQQFYEDELNSERITKGVLIIRGISDHADYDKDDKWRLPASSNAMKVLSEILIINMEDILSA